MLKWHMIEGITLLPYKRMGPLKQLQSPNIWGWNKKTKNVIVLQLSKWHHKWKIRYHVCYRAKVVLISLPKTIQSMKTIDVEIKNIDVKISILKQSLEYKT